MIFCHVKSWVFLYSSSDNYLAMGLVINYNVVVMGNGNGPLPNDTCSLISVIYLVNPNKIICFHNISLVYSHYSSNVCVNV